MKKHKREDFDRGWIDVLFTALFSIVVMLAMAAMMLNPKKTQDEGNVRKNADYVIEMEWPGDVNCDVDLWTMDPTGDILYFGNDDIALLNLDRDDLGSITDTLQTLDGTMIMVNENKEITTIRGVIPGEYIVNIHLYACRMATIPMGLGTPVNPPIPVTVTVTKINPRFQKLFTRKIELTRIWEERTALSFVIDEKKEASNFTTDQEVSMVAQRIKR